MVLEPCSWLVGNDDSFKLVLNSCYIVLLQVAPISTAQLDSVVDSLMGTTVGDAQANSVETMTTITAVVAILVSQTSCIPSTLPLLSYIFSDRPC